MAVLKGRIQDSKNKKSVLPFMEVKRRTSHEKRVTNVMTLGKAMVATGRWVTGEMAVMGRRGTEERVAAWAGRIYWGAALEGSRR